MPSGFHDPPAALDDARTSVLQVQSETNAFDGTFRAGARCNEGHFVADSRPLATCRASVERTPSTGSASRTAEAAGGLCNADNVLVDGGPVERTPSTGSACKTANVGKPLFIADNVVVHGQSVERRPAVASASITTEATAALYNADNVGVDGWPVERRPAAPSASVATEAAAALYNADNVGIVDRPVERTSSTRSASITTEVAATLYNAENVIVDNRPMEKRPPVASAFVTTKVSFPSCDRVGNAEHALDGSPQPALTSLPTAQRVPKTVPADARRPMEAPRTEVRLPPATCPDRQHQVVPQHEREDHLSRRYFLASSDDRIADSGTTQCALSGHPGRMDAHPVQSGESAHHAPRGQVLPAHGGALVVTAHGVLSLSASASVHASGGVASTIAALVGREDLPPMTPVHTLGGGLLSTRPAPLHTQGLTSQIPTDAHAEGLISQIPTAAHAGDLASQIPTPAHGEGLTSHEGGSASIITTPLHEGCMASTASTPIYRAGLTSISAPAHAECLASIISTPMRVGGYAPAYEGQTLPSTHERAVSTGEPHCIVNPVCHFSPTSSPIPGPKCNPSPNPSTSPLPNPGRLASGAPATSSFQNGPSIASPLVSTGATTVCASADSLINPNIKHLYVFTSEKNKSFDKDLQLRVIEELSIDTPHMRHALSMDRKNDERIAQMRAAHHALTAHELRHFDALAAQLEQNGDHDNHACAVIDMDMFFVACELLERPDLRELPVAVGKNVISTANYVARAYGVRSAMPGFIAEELVKRQGNTLIFLPVHFEKYKQASRAVQDVLERWSLSFKCPSLDEFYISCDGLTLADTAERMDKVRADIRAVTGLTASAGIGSSFMFAKMAADINKPNGQFVVPHELDERRAWLSPLSVRKVSGVGKVTQKILEAFGLVTLQDIVDNSAKVLALFGTSSTSYGPFLVHAALGHACGSWELHKDVGQKSISQETTFPALSDTIELREILFELCGRLWEECATRNLFPQTITLKVKKASFDTMTRCRTCATPVRSLDALEVVAWELLCLFKVHGAFPRVRLLGVRGSHWYDESDNALAADARSSKKRASLVCPATRTEKPIDSFFTKRQKNREEARQASFC